MQPMLPLLMQWIARSRSKYCSLLQIRIKDKDHISGLLLSVSSVVLSFSADCYIHTKVNELIIPIVL